MNTLNNDSKPLEPASPEQRRKPSRAPLATVVGVIIFIAGISVGMLMASRNNVSNISYDDATNILDIASAKKKAPQDVDFTLFWEAWQAVRDRHVDQPVDEKSMLYGAIAGMVSGIGDPYSVYFTPDEAKQFFSEISGNFEGIGAEIGIKNDVVTIIAPLPGSPAETAGLLAGDTILQIDGRDTSFMSLSVAVQYIRGEKGSSVTLHVQRDGASDPFDVDIVRDTIHIESVRWELRSKNEFSIGLLTISQFNSDTTQAFETAVNELTLQQPDAIIVDLRNNAGGFLDSSVQIASSFITEGRAVVIEQSGGNKEHIYTAEGPSRLSGIPTVALVNEGSASAAEILAGALQDHGIATVIGETSFGKGTVQDVQPFEDGSALKLTIARWLTPNRNHIDTVGIQPDYYVERTEDDFARDEDPQMEAALLFIANRQQFDAQYSPFDPKEVTDMNTNEPTNN